MPALDYLNKTASTTHDISASATSSATAVALGRSALPADLYCTVLVTAISVANFTTLTLKARFEYTTDNGTTYRESGSVSMKCGPNTAGVPLQAKSFPVGHLDIDPEQHTATSIKWRVTMTLSSTVSDADDYDWEAYLSHGPLGIGALND